MAARNIKIGVWMDHSRAMLIENDPFLEQIQTIESELDNTVSMTEEGEIMFGTWPSTDGAGVENRTNEIINDYFKKLETALVNYDEILLFGPGIAKRELKNYLCNSKKYKDKKVAIEAAEDLSENQLKAFVRDYFNSDSTSAIENLNM